VVRERLAATSSVVRKPVDNHQVNALRGPVYDRPKQMTPYQKLRHLIR
jgi:hypothetical protein